MTRLAWIALGFLVLIGVALIPRERSVPEVLPPLGRAPVSTPAPPRLAPNAVDRQDRVSPTHAQREARDLNRRPLLAILPVELAGVRIDVAGLHSDVHRTILTIRSARGTRFALDLYRRTLAAVDDGGAYLLRWERAGEAGQPTAGPPTPSRAVSVAETYALAATNWCPSSYAQSVSRQGELSTGRLRRQLGRPAVSIPQQERLLRGDRHCRLSGIVRLGGAGGHDRSRDVELDIDQLDIALGRRLREVVRYRVSLRRPGPTWRVVRFTTVGRTR